MGGPTDMNIDVFWETSVGFLKSVVCQLEYQKYIKSQLPLKIDGLF